MAESEMPAAAPEEATADKAPKETTTTSAAPAVKKDGAADDSTGPLTIAQYSQLYAVSRNPFGLAAILPLILFAFIGLEIGLLANIDVDKLLGGFMIVSTGLLLIPAVVLKGFITFDDKGINMRFGKQTLSASCDKVAVLTYEQDSGVCVLLKGQTQSRPKIRVAGGLHAEDGGEAIIPIRFFGDRRFAILYEVRDRVPESAWKHALQQAQPGSSRRPLIIYGLTVLFGIGCMIAVAVAVSPR